MEYVPKTLSSIIKDNIYSKSFIENKHITKYAYGLIKALAYLEVTFNLINRKKTLLTEISNPRIS